MSTEELSEEKVEAVKEKKPGFWSKAKSAVVKAVDQNGDGELDLKDAGIVADAIQTGTKKAVGAMKEAMEERARERELKQLQPIFADSLNSTDFFLSKLIRVTEMDKVRAKSEVCKDSIGYFDEQKDMKVVNIFRNQVEAFGLTFSPDLDHEVYYVDPIDRDHYIALDEYFNYMKVERVNELQRVAQALGAKHFKVTLKEQKASFVKNEAKAKASTKAPGNNASTDIDLDRASKDASVLEISAEATFPGHEPFEPVLCFLKRDSSVLNLISMRMDASSPITNQKFALKLSQSSGIKEKDAVKIDAALKAMKISGNTTVVSEAQHEARRFFEYEINF